MYQNPLKVKDEFWVYQYSSRFVSMIRDGVINEKTERKRQKNNKSGKWMLFVPEEKLNEAWQKIAKAIDNNILGNIAKVATAKPNSLAKDSKTKLICVYTDDYTDKEEVYRVVREIRKLGFTGTLYYKTDAATIAGKYGDKSWLYKDDDVVNPFEGKNEKENKKESVEPINTKEVKSIQSSSFFTRAKA